MTVGGFCMRWGRRWRSTSLVAGALVLAAATLATLGAAAGPAGAASGGETWNIGLICSCTGPEASSTSTSAPALQAWADAVNAAGGIDGHKVDLIVKDDQTSPTTALPEAQELVTSDHVVAIFDNSDVDNAFATYLLQQHVPVIGSYASSTEMYTNADFFPNGSTINWEAQQYIRMLKMVHSDKVATLYCAEVAICKQATEANIKPFEHAGIHTVYTSAISFAAPNYTAECLAAKQAGATAMSVGDASAIVVKVAENCATQGYNPVELGGDGTVAEDWRTTPSMNGNIDFQPDIPFFVDSTPATKAMNAAIDKYEPSLAHSPNFGEVVVEAWTSGLLFADAAKAAHLGNGATPAEVIKGLYDLHGDTLGGMAPPLTFTKNAPTTGTNCGFLMGIKDMHWTLPIGTGTFCVK